MEAIHDTWPRGPCDSDVAPGAWPRLRLLGALGCYDARPSLHKDLAHPADLLLPSSCRRDRPPGRPRMLVTIRIRTTRDEGRTALCELTLDRRQSFPALAESLFTQWEAEAGGARLDAEDRTSLLRKLEGWLAAHRNALRLGEAPVFEYTCLRPPAPAKRPRPLPRAAEAPPPPPADQGGDDGGALKRIEAQIDWQGNER